MGLRKFFNYLGVAFTRKKSLEANQSISTNLRRVLSTIDLTFIGIGSTIGAGIYVLTGEVAKNTSGPAIVLSFLISAVTSLLSGLCYGEFGARIPKAGSAYIYAYITLGELCGFFIGWNMILEYIIGGASIARGLSAYIDSLTHGSIKKGTIFLIGKINAPFLSDYFDLFSFVLVLFFTVILSTGVKDSARLNNACVLINLITIGLVIIVGLFYVEKDNWSKFAPYGASGVFAGAATCFFSFVGFDVIATTSEEARNPAWSIPISMTLTIIVCFVAYFGVSSVITMMVPYKMLDEGAAVANAFHQRGQQVMGHVIAVGATLGLSGCTLMSMLPLPRMMYALSQDGMIFKVFSNVNEQTGVPVVATWTAGFIIALLAVILDLNSLVEMLSIGTLSAYTVVDICVIVMRYCFNHESSTESNEKNFQEMKQKRQKNLAVYLSISVILFSSFGISLLYRLFQGHFHMYVFIIIGILGLISFISCVFLALCKQNDTNLSFKTPFLPWLPALAIHANAYLMVSLKYETWIRLGVWVIIGIFVYFGYSIRHSEEARQNAERLQSN